MPLSDRKLLSVLSHDGPTGTTHKPLLAAFVNWPADLSISVAPMAMTLRSQLEK